jgi:hypothetical protein
MMDWILFAMGPTYTLLGAVVFTYSVKHSELASDAERDNS